jgi:hypothetical protein
MAPDHHRGKSRHLEAVPSQITAQRLNARPADVDHPSALAQIQVRHG